MNPGELAMVFIGSTLLSSIAGWCVAALYQRRMVKLMRSGAKPDPLAMSSRSGVEPIGVAVGAAGHAGAGASDTADYAANRGALRRLMIALAVLALVSGIVQAVLTINSGAAGRSFSPGLALTLGLVYAWPMVLAWGFVLRWRAMRVLGVVALFMLLTFALVMARSTETQTVTRVAKWLAGLTLVPAVITLFLTANDRTRATAPYLFPVFLTAVAMSSIGLDVLGAAVNASTPPAWIGAIVDRLGAVPTFLLFMLAPPLLVAFPAYVATRRLADAYRRHRFSELGYQVGLTWLIVLFASAVVPLGKTGPASFQILAAWLVIPAGFLAMRRFLAPRAAPPTLLVLRVFQRDTTGRLFDAIIERWRLTGNTILIAGSDLLSRTLDPDDLFTYLDRRLALRFIASEGEVQRRIADLDFTPDDDGRYRVNECYCFDSTWKAALDGLARRADVVLMDLRGFRAENQGCRHELGVLARLPHLSRVVVLYDRATARDVAEEEISGAPDGRFLWLDGSRFGGRVTGDVMKALFATHVPAMSRT